MRCAYVLGVMSLYWVLGLIPEAVTALIPIALFPVLGILSTSEACAPYMKVSLSLRHRNVLICSIYSN